MNQPEKGKPFERAGRKAMGSKVFHPPENDDSPAASVSISFQCVMKGERNNGKPSENDGNASGIDKSAPSLLS